ncbi:MAG: hypothetical protein JJT93_08885 [Gammaproteobacteria bacterium]|nr:hypothetical protein [Gammaproteobacteria bacterium]
MADGRAVHTTRLAAWVLAGLLPAAVAFAGGLEAPEDALDETFLAFLADWDAVVGDAERLADGAVSGESGPAAVREQPGEQDDDDNERT